MKFYLSFGNYLYTKKDLDFQVFYYLFNNQESVLDSKGMLWVDAVVEHDAIDMVDFMLDHNGVEALEFQPLLFAFFVEIFKSDAGVADDIAWDFAVH